MTPTRYRPPAAAVNVHILIQPTEYSQPTPDETQPRDGSAATKLPLIKVSPF